VSELVGIGDEMNVTYCIPCICIYTLHYNLVRAVREGVLLT
jgi:hypothetical protein